MADQAYREAAEDGACAAQAPFSEDLSGTYMRFKGLLRVEASDMLYIGSSWSLRQSVSGFGILSIVFVNAYLLLGDWVQASHRVLRKVYTKRGSLVLLCRVGTRSVIVHLLLSNG